MQKKLKVGQKFKARLLEQLHSDTRWLERNNITDYSLLVGIHFVREMARGKGEHEKMKVEERIENEKQRDWERKESEREKEMETTGNRGSHIYRSENYLDASSDSSIFRKVCFRLNAILYILSLPFPLPSTMEESLQQIFQKFIISLSSIFLLNLIFTSGENKN